MSARYSIKFFVVAISNPADIKKRRAHAEKTSALAKIAIPLWLAVRSSILFFESLIMEFYIVPHSKCGDKEY